MKARVLLSLFMAFLYIFCDAQPVNNAVKDVTMAAPNAASLGKYGDIPVSYFTGVPNIGIPVFTIQEGPLSLPVNLNYHASGIKVGELASWVGLGWSLNAGGMISRTTMGIPDDVSGGYMNGGKNLLDPATPQATLEREDVADGIKDAEPDIFNYSFAGMNGKFVIDKDSVIHTLPKSDIKISYIRKDGTGILIRFVITTTDGTRYIFGGLETESDATQSAVETTTYDNVLVSAVAPTSWYLRRIETADQQYYITLDYVDEKYAYKNMGTCSVTWNYDGGGYSGTTSTYCGPTSYGTKTSIVNHYVTGKRLSQITNSSNTQKIVFVADTDRQDLDQYSGETGKRLDRIEFYTPVGTACPYKFEFNYDYMVSSGGTASEYKRLRLLSVQETSCSVSKEPYSFTYYSGTLPYRIYKGIDHWGYYNGVTTNEGELNIPELTVNWLGHERTPNFTTANRESDESSMLIGTLKQITYPTGGYNEFTFEANEVKQAVTTTTNNYSFSLSNCTYPSGNCCSTNQISGSDTFTTTELDQAQFSLKLYNLNYYPTSRKNCGDPNHTSQIEQYCNPSDPTPDGPTVQIIVKETGQTQGIESFSFNLASNEDYCEEIKNLTELANLQAGVSYTFTLYVTNGKGDFQIFNQSSSVTYESRTVGGLRVKQIKAHDGINSANDVIKDYEYTENDGSSHSSAHLYFEPQYYGIQQGYPANEIGLIFYSTPITPMGSYQGYHVGYQRVVEKTNGNGKTEYFYAVDFLAATDSYPYSPQLLSVQDGQLSLKKIYKQDQSSFTQIGLETITPYSDSYDMLPGWIYKAYKHPDPDILYPNQFVVYYKIYPIRTAPYRLLKQERTIDGVKTVTTYEYDPDPDKHLAPTAIDFTNSDGSVHRTEHKYVYDLSASEIRDSLISKNIVGTPIESIQKVGATIVDGMKFDYAFYNQSTGQEQGSGTGAHPYPHNFYRYEMTWESSGSVASGADFVLSGTIDSYHGTSSTGKGFPKQFTKTGWQPETYEWLNGKIKKRTFDSFEWEYTYLTGTQLLSSIKDIDGQIVSYEYDDLLRLKKTTARNGNVVTDYSYQFKDASNPHNYVRAKTTFTSVPNSSLTQRESFQYFDGLGRLLQTVEKGYSEDGDDVITQVKYDNQGRVYKSYEPYERNGNSSGDYFEVADGYQHTLTEYYNSPLNRVWKVTPPSWYPTETQYGNNASPITIGSQSFSAGELFVTTIIDGNDHQNITYTDKKGRQLMTTRADENGANGLDTKYIYDDKDRVNTVLPPGTSTNDDDLIYRYVYDGADNILSKKIPDQAWMSYWYDDRDLPTFSQDGNMAAQGKWLHTHYDNYGRPTATGFVNSAPSDGNQVANFFEELTRSHYDGCDDPSPSTIYTGKLCRTETNMLGTNDWLNTTIEYDQYGRIAKTEGNHPLHLTDWQSLINTFTYDFADNLTRQFHYQKLADDTDNYVEERMEYDHVGRLTKNYHKLNGGTEILTSELHYTAKDQVLEKNLGKEGSNFLQSLDYTYLPNGFLSKINDSYLGGTYYNSNLPACGRSLPNPGISGTNPDQNDLFYLELNYDQLQGSVGGDAQKNGNIAQVHWRVRGRFTQAYGFTYDYLDRLKTATHNGPNSDGVNQLFDMSADYDARGNITSLSRKGLYWDGSCWQKNTIDNLGYTHYNGTNRLQDVLETAPIASRDNGYQHYNTGDTGADYLYDDNGNLIYDPSKGISIEYNYLNLPKRMETSDCKIMEIQYDAAGNKISKTINSGIAQMYTHYYINGFEYRHGELEAVYHKDGRVYFEEGSHRYEYTITDHLGNTRLCFTDKNGNGKVDQTDDPETDEILQEHHYYPFGMEMDGPWMATLGRESKYLYNGKELNSELGLEWLDYGARWYDPSIGRFPAVDRFAEKYASMTPYQYGANNPISNIDINGDSIWVTAETVDHGDGTYTNYQTIRGDVKVLDLTGNVENMDVLASQFGRALNNSLKGKDGDLTIRSAINVKAVKSMDDVSDSDHLVTIVDDVVPDGLFSSVRGKAIKNGKIAFVQNWNGVVSTMVHEFGHNLGLEHNWEDGFEDSNNNKNYMSYGGEARNSFSNNQVVNIKQNVSDLNQGINHSIAPVTTNNRFWHTSTNRKPYLFNVKKGDRIPRTIN